ncbi:unnamed protein product [Caenorhabditis sp. 36 PRJEB53466]|nr:unnamed protein product [Caenorhabditis sp. 36 PRJEB53466]
MFKFLTLFAVLAALAIAQQPNPEQMKSELTAAGVSASGVSTISAFMESHKPGNGANHEQGKSQFDAMLATLSESDRSAFQKVMESKHPKGGPKH